MLETNNLTMIENGVISIIFTDNLNFQIKRI